MPQRLTPAAVRRAVLGGGPVPPPPGLPAVPVASFREHARRWQDCTRCSLCQRRARVVLARGIVPCDLLFVGEAPGESEDALGRPFVGPAGKLLDRIVARALDDLGPFDRAYTNLVACVPREEEGAKAGQPPDEAVKACRPRLEEFLVLADRGQRLRLLVAVGALARDWLDPGYRHSVRLPRPLPQVALVHPAAILRANVAQQGLLIQRAVVTLRNAVEELGAPPFAEPSRVE